jgi:FKBP12-rapamycin complex-associated protein
MGHSAIPTEVVLALLNVAEFMEHQDRPLPIDSKTLGELAFDFQAYAKALHYKELEYFVDNSQQSVIESLLNINTKLQQHDAAFGTLKLAKMTSEVDISQHEEWFEQLGRWQDALNGYTRRAEQDPDLIDIAIGRMRCLHALGEWEPLARIVEDNWDRANQENRKAIAPLAAAAAWSLHEWDLMDDYIQGMNHESSDRFFYRAILSVHRNNFQKAITQIHRARELLEPDFKPLVGENYARSYKLVKFAIIVYRAYVYSAMVRAQMLSELEEVIIYKQSPDQPERQETIRKTWMKRCEVELACCSPL